MCRKNIESKNAKVKREKNGKIMLLSKWAAYDSKKWRLIKYKEARVLLCSLGLRTPLIKIPLVDSFLF